MPYGCLFAAQALPFLQVPDVILYVAVAPQFPVLEVGAENGAVIQLHEGELVDLQCPVTDRKVFLDPLYFSKFETLRIAMIYAESLSCLAFGLCAFYFFNCPVIDVLIDGFSPEQVVQEQEFQ